jgi:NADH:ubiquinone oxidoreductase subunit 6 (subunit J)
MNKKVLVGSAVAIMLLVVLSAAVIETDWDNYTNYDTPQPIPYTDVVDGNNNINESSLNYAIFEEYGPLLLVLALLMFGAMVGGICIAREEVEKDDSN